MRFESKRVSDATRAPFATITSDVIKFCFDHVVVFCTRWSPRSTSNAATDLRQQALSRHQQQSLLVKLIAISTIAQAALRSFVSDCPTLFILGFRGVPRLTT
jgi:hypothetical protein